MDKPKRKHIPLKEKLASALCHMMVEVDGKFEPAIPHEMAKDLTSEQVLSLFNWDHHPIPHAWGGPDAHWNLTPRFIREHREKTAKTDQPRMAKVKRIRNKGAQAFADRLNKAGLGVNVRVEKGPPEPVRREDTTPVGIVAGEPDTSDIPEVPKEWFDRARIVTPQERAKPKRKIQSRGFPKPRGKKPWHKRIPK